MADEKGRIRTPISPATWITDEPEPEPVNEPEPVQQPGVVNQPAKEPEPAKKK